VVRRRRFLALAVLTLLVALPVLGGIATGGADSQIVSVFPIPGSRVAPPQTQIVFRGIPIERLGSITVTGSRSGAHKGRVLADSDGSGGSFLPSRPFAPGERVTVRVRPHLLARGRSFSFTVATPAGPAPHIPPTTSRAPNDVLSFRSRPDLEPPAVEITKDSAPADQGDIFLAPEHGPIQSGPEIVAADGSLVWFHPLPQGQVATNFRVQRFHGKPVLTWWQGYMGAGVGEGEDVIMDSAYRQVALVHAANGLSADLHEFQLTSRGTALITAYYPVWWDARSVGGARQTLVFDCVVQEIDVRTGLLLFQWDSLDHVPLTYSYEPLPHDRGHPFDYFHINSIQRDADGSLIVSARNTWAVYKVDGDTGRVIWTLGGKHSSFKLPPAASFAFQHDVRVRSRGDQIVTVFDDGAGPPIVHTQSRGLTLQLDPRHWTGKVLRVDTHDPSLVTEYEGDLQQLPDGGQFLGWGALPFFSEFDQAGHMVLDGRFVGRNTSYRAYRFPWRGQPTTAPSVVASTSGDNTYVYASWNGATDVASWQVLAGTSPDALHLAGSGARKGFETELVVPMASYVAVRALDAAGHILATSSSVRVQ
jgi:Arylsulfotransferase (ASST)